MKILITLEPYGMFGSNFAYLIILILFNHPGLHDGGEGLPSIIFAGYGLIVKMLITLERHFKLYPEIWPFIDVRISFPFNILRTNGQNFIKLLYTMINDIDKI